MSIAIYPFIFRINISKPRMLRCGRKGGLNRKAKTYTVGVYTGFTLEQIMDSALQKNSMWIRYENMIRGE